LRNFFLGSKRNAKRSHFPPSRTQTNKNGAPYLKAEVHIFRNEFLESNLLDYNIYGTALFQCNAKFSQTIPGIAKECFELLTTGILYNFVANPNLQELGTEETMTAERIMRTTTTAERIMRMTTTAARIMRMTTTAERIMRTTTARITQLTH
jgi:hypothetical protein